jgi:hypothetical protein
MTSRLLSDVTLGGAILTSFCINLYSLHFFTLKTDDGIMGNFISFCLNEIFARVFTYEVGIVLSFQLVERCGNSLSTGFQFHGYKV